MHCGLSYISSKIVALLTNQLFWSHTTHAQKKTRAKNCAFLPLTVVHDRRQQFNYQLMWSESCTRWQVVWKTSRWTSPNANKFLKFYARQIGRENSNFFFYQNFLGSKTGVTSMAAHMVKIRLNRTKKIPPLDWVDILKNCLPLHLKEHYHFFPWFVYLPRPV